MAFIWLQNATIKPGTVSIWFTVVSPVFKIVTRQFSALNTYISYVSNIFIANFEEILNKVLGVMFKWFKYMIHNQDKNFML